MVTKILKHLRIGAACLWREKSSLYEEEQVSVNHYRLAIYKNARIFESSLQLKP